MPKAPLQTHDLGSIFLVIGTSRISAWGESGGVTLKPNADLATVMVGAGGHAVVSRSGDVHYTAEVTVQRESEDYALLQGMLAAQHPATGGAIERLSFLLANSITGEKLSTDYAVFTIRPDLEHAKEAGEATFTLFLYAPEHILPS